MSTEAKNILEARLARGEIDEEQYAKLLKLIEADAVPPAAMPPSAVPPTPVLASQVPPLSMPPPPPPPPPWAGAPMHAKPVMASPGGRRAKWAGLIGAGLGVLLLLGTVGRVLSRLAKSSDAPSVPSGSDAGGSGIGTGNGLVGPVPVPADLPRDTPVPLSRLDHLSNHLAVDRKAPSLFGCYQAVGPRVGIVGTWSRDDGGAFLFDVHTRRLIAHGKGPPGTSGFGGAVAIDGDTAVVGASRTDDAATGSRAFLLDVRTRALTELTCPRPEPQDSYGYAVAIAGNTAIVTARGGAFLFDTATGRYRGELVPSQPAEWYGWSVAAAAGDRVVVGTQGIAHGPFLFDLKTGRQIARLTSGGGVSSECVDVNERFVVTGLGDGVIWVFDAATGLRLTSIKINGQPKSFKLAGSHLIVGCSTSDGGGVVMVYDAATGRITGSMAGQDTTLSRADFGNEIGYAVTSPNEAVLWVGAPGDQVAGSGVVFSKMVTRT